MAARQGYPNADDEAFEYDHVDGSQRQASVEEEATTEETAPASADGRPRRGDRVRKKWRGGAPPAPPVLEAYHDNVYKVPKMYTRWTRSVEAWEARVRHYKPLSDDSPTRGDNHFKAATASSSRGSLALLYGEEAARVMATRPTRLPDLVLRDPHEAKPMFHEDWTLHEDWEKELRLREARNRLIRENFDNGKTVFYKSSGSSMWPLCQNGDAVLMHPIRAVTVKDGGA